MLLGILQAGINVFTESAQSETIILKHLLNKLIGRSVDNCTNILNSILISTAVIN